LHQNLGLAELVAASPFADDSSAGDLSKLMSLIKVPSNVEPELDGVAKL
jgi:hypothetical protein